MGVPRGDGDGRAAAVMPDTATGKSRSMYVTEDESGDLVPDWEPDGEDIEGALRYGVQYFLGVVELAAIAHAIQPELLAQLGEYHERLRALRGGGA
jgi:hypothetical protein